jgi:REP-associated tyrosine transposase
VLEDGLFHAYSRGTGPMVIYRDPDDYERFASMLRATARRFEWRLLAFCLMPTHYHLVLEARREALSRGMHRLNGFYAHQFNRRHSRVGHLFQERFATRVVEDDGYLERLCLYVITNPVRAGHCDTPADWPWTWSAFGLDIS